MSQQCNADLPCDSGYVCNNFVCEPIPTTPLQRVPIWGWVVAGIVALGILIAIGLIIKRCCCSDRRRKRRSKKENQKLKQQQQQQQLKPENVYGRVPATAFSGQQQQQQQSWSVDPSFDSALGPKPLPAGYKRPVDLLELAESEKRHMETEERKEMVRRSIEFQQQQQLQMRQQQMLRQQQQIQIPTQGAYYPVTLEDQQRRMSLVYAMVPTPQNGPGMPVGTTSVTTPQGQQLHRYSIPILVPHQPYSSAAQDPMVGGMVMTSEAVGYNTPSYQASSVLQPMEGTPKPSPSLVPPLRRVSGSLSRPIADETSTESVPMELAPAPLMALTFARVVNANDSTAELSSQKVHSNTVSETRSGTDLRKMSQESKKIEEPEPMRQTSMTMIPSTVSSSSASTLNPLYVRTDQENVSMASIGESLEEQEIPPLPPSKDDLLALAKGNSSPKRLIGSRELPQQLKRSSILGSLSPPSPSSSSS